MEHTSVGIIIGTRIKQRRKELGLTQMQIKQETGISSGNLSDIENGNKLPSAPALISLSAILDCSIDWILKGEKPETKDSFLTNEREKNVIDIFRKLPESEKEELIQLLHIKLKKTQTERKPEVKSSPLNGIEDKSMVG